MMDCFYFQNGTENMFGAWHSNPEKRQKGSLLFISAFAEEKNASRRVEYCLANKVSNVGFSTLRFDFRGTGDSDGDFKQFSLQDEISDIQVAWEKMLSLGGEEKKGIVGFRWGVNQALMISKMLNPDFIIGIAPITNTSRYLKDLLRKNVAAQMGLYGHVVKTSQQIVSDLERGDSFNYEGFLISGLRYEQMLGTKSENYDKPILVFNNGTTTKNAGNDLFENCSKYLEISTLLVPAFWLEQNYYYTNINSLSESITKWVEANV